jgi:hypothetical protein
MGFSWSSYVAQSCATAICRKAGLGKHKQLAPDLPVPNRSREVFCIATNDIIHFSKSRAAALMRMNRVDNAFKELGIEKHPAKDVDGTLCGRCLGIDLSNGTALSPAAGSFFHLLCCCVYIGTSDFSFAVAPRAIAALMGLAQWFCLINRPMLSLVAAVYTLCVVSLRHALKLYLRMLSMSFAYFVVLVFTSRPI